LVPVAFDLMKNEEQKKTLSRNISQLAIKDSAHIIAHHVLSLIKN